MKDVFCRVLRLILIISLAVPSAASTGEYEALINKDINELSAGAVQAAQSSLDKEKEAYEFFDEEEKAFEELSQSAPALNDLGVSPRRVLKMTNAFTGMVIYAKNGFWLAADKQLVHLLGEMHHLENKMEKRNFSLENMAEAFSVILRACFNHYIATYKEPTPLEKKRLEGYWRHVRTRLQGSNDFLNDRNVRVGTNSASWAATLGYFAAAWGSWLAVIPVAVMTDDSSETIAAAVAFLIVYFSILSYFDKRHSRPTRDANITVFETAAVQAVKNCDLFISKRGSQP